VAIGDDKRNRRFAVELLRAQNVHSARRGNAPTAQCKQKLLLFWEREAASQALRLGSLLRPFRNIRSQRVHIAESTFKLVQVSISTD